MSIWQALVGLYTDKWFLLAVLLFFVVIMDRYSMSVDRFGISLKARQELLSAALKADEDAKRQRSK